MNAMESPRRYAALDGLRGVAALSVVICHGFLTSAALADAYISHGRGSGWAHILTYTPLHIVWAGREAVVVFFVLSGVVLTLPRLRPQAESWFVYYPKRMLRLYLPVIGAVVLSVLFVVGVGRDNNTASWWMNTHTRPSAGQFAHDLTLIAGTGSVNTALWSLEWEVWFSLLLPVFVWLALMTRRLGFVTGFVAIAAAMIFGWRTGIRPLTSLPIFGVGVLLAVHYDRLSVIFDHLWTGAVRRIWTGIIVVLALAALTAQWWFLGLGARDTAANCAGVVGVLVGAALLVMMAMRSTGLSRALMVRPIRWLGTRSFSLYLIHEPIMVSVATIIPNQQNPAVVTLIGLAVSLAFAEIFCRFLERPSHQFARRVGASVGDLITDLRLRRLRAADERTT
jgi:peptidoglycan/LPS O-acetylase OafA/YrhL